MNYIIAVVLVITLVALGPLLTIWSLNILFPSLAIGYTIETWCAIVILGILFKAGKSK